MKPLISPIKESVKGIRTCFLQSRPKILQPSIELIPLGLILNHPLVANADAPLPQPAIALGEGVGRPVSPPGVAVVVVHSPIGGRDLLSELVRPLQVLDRQPARDVPGDVAVEQPGSRVVGLERDQEPPFGGEHGDVASGRVAAPKTAEVGSGKDEALLGAGLDIRGAAQDHKVVPVEVHWVGEGEGSVRVVFYQPVGPLLFLKIISELASRKTGKRGKVGG